MGGRRDESRQDSSARTGGPRAKSRQAASQDKAGPAERPDKLAAYRGKRDFNLTPEPSGSAAGPAGERARQRTTTAPAPATAGQAAAPRFVVQRHRARRTHYDLRFEIGDVLVSFAVPRGPTLDPAVKRTAVHVEDHPIEYLEFEGVIPAGEYGGGDVIVWDRGTWEPHATDDPAAAIAAGDFHADLRGHKLSGRFVLVRRDGDGRRQEQWLLLHKHDEFAVTGWDPDEHPRSVLSGRTNEEVKADPERMWDPGLPPSEASVLLRPPAVAGASGEEFATLDALGASGRWEVFGRSLALTNLDKVLFPPASPGEAAVTKRELIRYAAEIAPVILPYLQRRPLNMHRFPGGADTKGFWHKQLPDHAPGWVPRWRDPDAGAGKTSTYLVADEPAALVWAANFGALEWHAWTSCTDEPSLPSYVLIDLDPGPATSWDDLLVLARLHRTALAHLGVVGCAKVTGRRGIQVWVPIERGPDFARTREWAAGLSKAVGAVVPDLVSWKWDVRERGGRARLDYTQNVHNKTLVAPYSPRAAPGAPVSTPITWDELDDPSLRPDAFTIRSIPARLAQHGDLFRPVLTTHQTLPPLR